MTNCVSQLREDWRLARAAHEDLVRMGRPRVNMLFTGTEGVIENMMDALLPDLREPIGRWCPGEQLLLPPPSLIGTMIFHEIGKMPYLDQHRLNEWLETAAGKTQVISTTTEPLFSRVEAGLFVDALYYRLNIICMDVTV